MYSVKAMSCRTCTNHAATCCEAGARCRRAPLLLGRAEAPVDAVAGPDHRHVAPGFPDAPQVRDRSGLWGFAAEDSVIWPPERFMQTTAITCVEFF